MENKQNIVNELKEISPIVAQVGFSNPYEVPQGYFENFAATVLQRIKATTAASPKEELEMLSPLLGSIGKKNPFSMPEGYFAELTENAMAGAKAIDFVNGELENLSPVMSSLKNKPVYEVPAGYFEQLPEKLLQRVKSQPARTVSMNFTRRVMRYAAAAVVAGLIVLGGWLYFGNNGTGTTNDPALAQISDEMLENYLDNQSVTPAETTVLASNGDADIDSDDLKDLLADVSDAELQKYIDQYGAKEMTN